MSLAFRPLIAILLMSVATGSLAAKKKPVAKAVAAAPAACSDFYAHINQPWLQAHPLPAGAASFSRWDELNANAERQTRQLFDPARPPVPGQANNLLSQLTASAQDGASVDAAARRTAQPLLAQVNALRNARDIAKLVAALHAAGVPVLYGFDALRDPDSGQARATFYPGGIGLPDPAFYTSSAPELQRALVLYRAYLGELLRFSGVPEASVDEQAGAALAIESALAAAMTGGNTEAISVAQAGKAYPALLLPDFMQAQGAAPAVLGFRQPAYFKAVDQLLAKPQIAQWQAYLRVQIAHSLAGTMARDLRQPYLAALGLATPGSTALAATDRLSALARQDAAELVSGAYLETYLAPATEQRAEAVGEGVRAAMGRALDRADWLSVEGRAAARSKLGAMTLAIGRPVEPAAFAGLAFERGNYAGNVLALRRWNRSRSLARLTSAVWPWPVSQAQPMIGYQPGANRLIVTAAALQAPAFEGKSTAADYGSLGALLAQQMSLAFADFTENDGRALAYRQAGLIAQFNGYPVSPTASVNGTRMQRQNAADLAAIELAWSALAEKGAPDALASKEFFSTWAAVWARQDSPTALAAAQAQSAFAPARWRVNGPLVNTPAFAHAFACKAGQPMFKPANEQLAIWR